MNIDARVAKVMRASHGRLMAILASRTGDILAAKMPFRTPSQKPVFGGLTTCLKAPKPGFLQSRAIALTTEEPLCQYLETKLAALGNGQFEQ